MGATAADYGAYIWTAYGATALVTVALVLRAVLDMRAQRRALARLDREGADAGEPG